MKKKLLVAMLVGTTVIGGSNVAFASEVKAEESDSIKIEESVEQEVSEDAMNELRYAVEEMNIALGKLRSEKLTDDNVEYILTFGSTAIERIRPFFDELSGNDYTSQYVGYINMAWTEINEAHDEYNQKKEALQELEYAYSEITIATEKLDKEGMNKENNEYIVTFGETAVERLRPYLEQLESYENEEINKKINAVRDGWDKILKAHEEFMKAEDNTTEGPVLDGTAEDNFDSVENPDEYVPDNTPGDVLIPEGPVLDGTAEDNFDSVENPDEYVPDNTPGDILIPEGPVLDGTAEDNFLIDAKVEAKPEVKPETSLPKTGTSSNVGALAAGIGMLAAVKLLLGKK